MADPIVIEERLATRELCALLGVGAVGVLVRRRRRSSSSMGRLLAPLRRLSRASALPVLGILIWLASSVVVRVVEGEDGRRLEVLYGPNGVVRQVFEPGEILDARVATSPLWRWGGLGYRGSLRLFKRAAVLTRRGEVLELQLTRGRRFLVSVDEPGDFAAALTA